MTSVLVGFLIFAARVMISFFMVLSLSLCYVRVCAVWLKYPAERQGNEPETEYEGGYRNYRKYCVAYEFENLFHCINKKFHCLISLCIG